MERCEQNPDQLLDYLYDLLEPEQQQELKKHLGNRAHCQAGLEQARQQRQVLARASRLQFPGVRFELPSARPATLPMGTPPIRRWGRWAAAAAILLAVTGAGFSALRAYQHYSSLEQQVELAKAYHDDAVARTDSRTADCLACLNKLHGQAADCDREEHACELVVHVAGAEVPQPGGHYAIYTSGHLGRPVAADVTLRLMDDTRNQVVAEPAVTAKGPGTYLAVLPSGTVLPTTGELKVRIEARRQGSTTVPLAAAVKSSNKTNYRTQLITDRPVYHPGETVRFRSLTLERATLTPPAADFQLICTVKRAGTGEEILRLEGSTPVADAKGNPLQGPDGKPLRGLGAGEFVLEVARFPEGEYVLTVREARDRFPAEQRTFRVRNEPIFTKGLEFDRPFYAPNQEVVAIARARRNGEGHLIDREVKATLTIDGQAYDAQGQPVATPQPLGKLRTDNKGQVRIAFRLPEQIERGDARLAVEFIDGLNRETLAQSVPVVVARRDVSFYPEGGSLVAGVHNRVYFESRTPTGRAVELRGQLVDDQGKVMCEIATFHDAEHPAVEQGAGVFEFTPQAGRMYLLRLGAQELELPRAEAGVALSIPGGVFEPDQPIRVLLRSTLSNRTFWVTTTCRGLLIDQQRVPLQGTETGIELQPTPSPGGVCRVTVFEERRRPSKPAELVPVAERLIYCKPSRRLQITANPEKVTAAGADKVNVSLRAMDETGRPTSAVVLLDVVEKRALAGHGDEPLSAHFFLTGDVGGPEDLEDADFLLSGGPKAREALDLFLGTQGWRHFTRPTGLPLPVPPPADDRVLGEPERLLVLNAQAAPDPKFMGELAERRREISDRKKEEKDREAKELTQLRSAVDSAQDDYRVALGALLDYEEWLRAVRRGSQTALAVVLGLLAAGFLALALIRHAPRAMPYYAGAAVCTLLLAGLTIMTFGPSLGNDLLARLPAGEMKQGDEQQLAMLDQRLRDAWSERTGPSIRPMALMRPMITPGGSRLDLATVRIDGGTRPTDRPAVKQERLDKEELLAVPARTGSPANPPAPPQPALQPLVYREYAYRRPARIQGGTLYWHPALVLPNGQLDGLGFDLASPRVPVEIHAYGYSLDGRLGSVTIEWSPR